MRLWAILKFPVKLISFYELARQSSFAGFKNKWEVWRILTVLTIKRAFEKNSKEPKCHKIFGYSVYCYDYSNLLYLFVDIFLRNTYRFCYTGKNPVIIDCGANIGMATLFFKKLYPGSRIIAFEPNPFAFRLLEKNISINRIKNVVLYNEALSTTEGTVSFFMNDDKGTLIGSLIRERGGNITFDVKARKLSDVIAEINPDLVKIDVEGAEHEIIEDLQKAGKLSVASRYIIEYHHQINGQKPRLAGFLKKFESEDFSYNLRTDFGTVERFQDIIISFTRQEAGKKNSLFFTQITNPEKTDAINSFERPRSKK